jgi:putative protease
LSEPGRTVALPLVAEPRSSTPTWHGWTPVGNVTDAPEPAEPQGAYRPDAPELSLQLPPVAGARSAHPVELLAPAGGPEAAFAAFHFGADAVYLGLKKFSARAEAENFTLDELDEITAYAHSLQPRRRVFVTINTLIRQDELPELVEAVAALDVCGVDAVILQDLGVYHLLREHFPRLELHASTQLAVHNRAGAETLHRLGFQRVVLARELTFEEVGDITATAGIETEVFIHGALCYSYSGLCLFSSQTLGRSGNRGKCAYSCRDSYDVAGAPLTLRDGTAVRRDPRQGFPFSMKDLALPDHLPALRAAGVSCFKVEGRKKSPLYVATTTDYYRRLLDGRLAAAERPQLEADLQTVFSRPWTRLFVQSHKEKEVADRDTVGHRGTLIGRVETIRQVGGESRLRFRTRRALERHDGLQIDLPILSKPFGFPVDRLWVVPPGKNSKPQGAVQAPAGALVEVSLPRDHASIPTGAPVYCASSQAVKIRYRHSRPKPGLYRTRWPVAVEVVLTGESLTAIGRVHHPRDGGLVVEVQRRLSGPFAVARDPAAQEVAVRGAFDRFGPTCLALESFTFRNEDHRFVPVSRLNEMRRELAAELEAGLARERATNVAQLRSAVCPANSFSGDAERSADRIPREIPPALRSASRRNDGGAQHLRWSIKVDRIGFLDSFEDADLASLDEVVVDLAREHPTLLLEKLDTLAHRLGRDHIRLALPAITRRWEERGLLHKIRQLRDAGWTNWEAANLSAWSYLGLDPRRSLPDGLDLSTDWSVYVLNRLAAHALLRLGVSRFALSPEDGLGNLRPLLAEFGSRAVVIVHQDTPQFVAESCAYANLIGGCPGKTNCRFESMEMVSSHGERVTALDYHCRTIVLNQGPFCLSRRLPDLAAAGAVNVRADFVYRRYEPAEVRRAWRQVRAGQAIAGGHAANFDRGLL